MRVRPQSDPFAPFAAGPGFLVLDGGLATELEAAGCDLNDELWSARVLLEDPAAIRSAHHRYLVAGADCIATATYQASFEGFRARGMSEAEAQGLFGLAVDLAVGARDAFWADRANRADRLEPLVAASLGPYGAVLADGSEYRGDYGLSRAELRAFHEPRWQAVAGRGADLTAWETVPSAREALALRDLLLDAPERYAWISFSCRDERRICDGTPIADVAAEIGDTPNLVAIGINCTQPHLVTRLTAEVRGATQKTILVYPNAGGRYDAERKQWETEPTRIAWDEVVPEWRAGGAFGVGGCCRVAPADIVAIRRVLEGG